VYKLDGNVLGIRGVRATAESEQATSTEEAFCHFAAGIG
jgi:hypothetical protein